MEDWEQTIKDAANKGLLTFGKTKDGDSLLTELKRKAEVRDKPRPLWILFESPKVERDAFDWEDFFKANRN